MPVSFVVNLPDSLLTLAQKPLSLSRTDLALFCNAPIFITSPKGSELTF